MATLTMKQINQKIKKQYPDLDIEFVKGEGYFYFAGMDSIKYDIQSIYTMYLYNITIEEVFDRIDTYKAEYEKYHKDYTEINQQIADATQGIYDNFEDYMDIPRHILKDMIFDITQAFKISIDGLMEDSTSEAFQNLFKKMDDYKEWGVYE